jgi:signal transduction histidine kinase
MDLSGQSHTLYRRAVWLTAALPSLALLLALDPTYRTPQLAGWAACYALFLALMAAGRRWPRRLLPLLALQSTAALAAAWVAGTSAEGAMQVAVAAQLASRVPLSAAMLVALGQSIALGLILGVSRPLEIAVDVPAAWFAFQAFAILLTHVARSEAEGRAALLERNVQLLATRHLLAERTRTAERLRMARDLHDGLGHHLTALSLNLEAAAYLVDGDAREHIARAQSVAKSLLGDVRSTVSGVRDEGLDPLPAIRALVEPIDMPRVHLTTPDALPVTDAARAETLLRLVQEIVTNALRHAQASNLWISVSASARGIEIDGRDDGRGATSWRDGNGLRGMRERLAELGGSLDIVSAPGTGFAIHARIPHAGAGA